MSTLSLKQKKILGIEAGKAFANLERHGLIELPADLRGCSKTARMDFWRQQQVAEVTQRVSSFCDAVQEEYRPLLAHFEQQAGKVAKAFDTQMKDVCDAACHREPGCAWVREMREWMAKAGYSAGYAAAIMRAKFKTTELSRLSERQLKQLHDTVVNRCRAKLGKGHAENRNKKQRNTPGQLPQQADQLPAEPGGRTYILRPPQAPRPIEEDPEIPF